MNEKLKESEKEMFISIYGEEVFEKLNFSPKLELPKEYSENPPNRLRFEVDKRNNLN